MNKSIKVIAAFVAAFLSLSAISAKDSVKKYSAPNKKEVMIVGNFSLNKKIDRDFYAKSCKISDEDKTNEDSLQVDDNDDRFFANNYIFYNVKIPKDRKIHINNIYLNLFNSDTCIICLPAYIEIVVPQDTSYVYLGNITYTMEGDDFTITGVHRTDEISEATDMLHKYVDSSAELTRVELHDYDPDKSDK